MTAFIDALNHSSLNSALMSLSIGGAPTGGMNPFHREGLNRSRMVRLAWWGAPDAGPPRPGRVEASVRLEVPGGYGRPATHLRIETDMVVRYSAAAEIARQHDTNSPNTLLPHWRVPPQQLGALINAALATLTCEDVTGPLADLGGIDALAVPQPRVMHMVTGRPVTEVLDTTWLKPIQDAGVSRGAHLLADPALDLADDEERSEQVRRWLIQIALDAGLTGMEQALERLGAANPVEADPGPRRIITSGVFPGAADAAASCSSGTVPQPSPRPGSRPASLAARLVPAGSPGGSELRAPARVLRRALSWTVRCFFQNTFSTLGAGSASAAYECPLPAWRGRAGMVLGGRVHRVGKLPVVEVGELEGQLSPRADLRVRLFSVLL